MIAFTLRVLLKFPFPHAFKWNQVSKVNNLGQLAKGKKDEIDNGNMAVHLHFLICQ